MTSSPTRSTGRRQRGALLWNGLSLPGAILLIVVFVAPIVYLVLASFGTSDILGRPTFANGFTLRNFENAFADYNLPLVLRTVAYAGIATILCIVLGYSVAYFAARFGGRFGLAIIALVLVPWLVDYLVRIYGWRTIAVDNGLVNSVLGGLGLGPVHLLGTPGMVILGLVYGYLPLMVLPIYASLGQLNPEVIDAGKDLYGNPWSTFWHVTFPLTREGVVGGVLLVFLPILGDFATAQFLGGPDTTMIGNVISDQFISAGSQPLGAAMTTVLIVGLLAAIAFASLAGRRRNAAAVI